MTPRRVLVLFRESNCNGDGLYRHTSQTCHECGHVAKGNRVTQAEFRCLSCGHEAHADVNAAKNILRLGQSQRDADVKALAEREAPSEAATSVDREANRILIGLGAWPLLGP